MNWILHPLTYYLLLASGLMFCLYLFVSLKKESALLRRRQRDDHDTLVKSVESFRHSLLQLQSALADQPQPRQPADEAPVFGAALNFNKRSQALRMYRRGEPAEKISAALQMPRNEVDLILKVHHASAGQE
ncbi:MAG: hypothetical protein HY858_16590 [Candidatus Solibacter usitatus]|nr:hypothetical protein [Candidatus Solibacter usitatus]